MALVADRFIVHGNDHVVDLATGRRVMLVTVPVAADAAELAWNTSCDWFQRLHHPAIAPLLDYGPLASGARFEAWQCGPTWNGAEAEAVRTRQSAGEFLRHEKVGVRDVDLRVYTRHVTPVIIPPTGIAPIVLEPRAFELPLSSRGLLFVQHRAIAALAEMFRELSGPRLYAAALWGPCGSGKTRIVSELARLARLRGFVPVCARFVDSPCRDLWRGRSLFVIDDEEGGSWRAILHAAIESPMPHALLRVGPGEVSGVDGIAMSPLKIDDLVDAIVPRAMSPAIYAEARRLAEQSQGWPGRFVDALSGPTSRTTRRAPVPLPRVAEQPALYGSDEQADSITTPMTSIGAPAGEWPAPGELPALRRRVTSALGDLDRGRHARGVRNLRQAIGGLSRRDGWIDAADGALALGAALLERGAVRDAQKALADARIYASRIAHDRTLVDVAILSGEAWIDLARLDEAESVLAAAMTAATALGDPARVALASVGLARCLFWRGRYDEARTAIERDLSGLPEAVGIRRACWRSRIACARGDGAGALGVLVGLTDTPQKPACPLVRAVVRGTEAWVRLSIGDARGAATAAEEAIRDARHTRRPLRAIRARLALAEAERRQGQTGSALARLQRLDRLRSAFPPIIAARLRLLLLLARNGRSDVATHIAESGIPGLASLAPPAGARAADQSLEPLVDEVIAIVRACQTADEERVVLKDVCGRMRQQLHAASVAFVGAGLAGSTLRSVGERDVLACDGTRMDLEIAERAMDAGILIHPHRRADQVEAAIAIQYAGATIGALCVRWTFGSTHDHSPAAAMLAAAGVVSAPILWAAMRGRERVAATGPEILGVTPEILELRRHVDRAAAAPFPVLILGESGSGKELVARAIHRHSHRRERPFRTLNCASIPEDLADAELFGHVRGSFTGAFADRAGVFEEAHGGTLLLDEVGELPARVQAKLLRVLQEGEVRRVGENLSRRVDVRIIAATNRDLAAEAEHGRFRADLLYRLDVIRVVTPSLRDRVDDIALLVDHYWKDAVNRIGSRATLAAATVGALARHHWPGNVRELQNVLAALAVRCPKRGVVPPSALPPVFATNGPSEAWRLDEARRAFEHRFVRAALVRSGGHRARAAQELGVTRQGLTKLLARLGIS